MGEVTDISNALTVTVKESELQNVSLEIAESIGDSFLQDGILKDIPILGTITGIYKASMSIRDKMLMKKLVYFLNEIKNVPIEKREEQIEKIENSKEYRTSVGEKLINIIDRSDDLEKADMVGRMFKAFLEKQITYDDFLRAATSINSCILSDLRWFIDSDWEDLNAEEGSDFLSSGLVRLVPDTPRIKKGQGFIIDDERDETYEDDEFKIVGGELKCVVSSVGRDLRKILSDNKNM